ncbi:MAG: glutamate synthase [Thermodesulfovibrionales bacterium]|nr:glutamate synthase [Thermodesulfovibrionales bacterium]
MCRLVAITSGEYFSPMENILALETMKEGHDGSGMGLVLKDLGGEFRELKDYPVLSGICSKDGYKTLNEHMERRGFQKVHAWSPAVKPVKGVAGKDYYFAKVYRYPESYLEKSQAEKEELLLRTRLELRRMGEQDESIVVFSFYPDVISLKEVGDPLTLGEFFGLDKSPLKAKIIFAQGRQNTNYEINLYACHPFFIQGYGSMTNGENTAFVPVREYLVSRGFPGYTGYQSDSEVFTHILHYAVRQLGYPLTYYKDIITPLKGPEIEGRPDSAALRLLKSSLRMLAIDGPNCVIGFTPDGTCFMVQDSKKLRPGVVGGVKGKYALVSEECGLDRAIPKRDGSKDVFPMKYGMVIVSSGAEEVKVWDQLKGEIVPHDSKKAGVC